MFRLITESDRESYFEMSKCFYSSGAAIKEIDDAKRNVFWCEILKAQQIKGYIFEEDGKHAGYALTVEYPSQEYGGTVLWVDELFVKPEFRGRKIARKFFAFAESICENVALRLEAEPDNERAIKLYERLGFEKLPYLQMVKTKRTNLQRFI